MIGSVAWSACVLPSQLVNLTSWNPLSPPCSRRWLLVLRGVLGFCSISSLCERYAALAGAAAAAMEAMHGQPSC